MCRLWRAALGVHRLRLQVVTSKHRATIGAGLRVATLGLRHERSTRAKLRARLEPRAAAHTPPTTSTYNALAPSITRGPPALVKLQQTGSAFAREFLRSACGFPSLSGPSVPVPHALDGRSSGTLAASLYVCGLLRQCRQCQRRCQGLGRAAYPSYAH